jgi:hypothetical protein
LGAEVGLFQQILEDAEDILTQTAAVARRHPGT